MHPKNRKRSSVDCDSPFCLYRREVQSFHVLNKKEEENLHQIIEYHLQSILKICTEVPECLEIIHTQFKKITIGKLKIDTLLYGFAFPEPLQKLELLEVQQRLFKLQLLQYEVQGKLIHLGSKAPQTQKSQEQLLEGLNAFKWSAQIIDLLVRYLQTTYEFPPLKERLHKALKAIKQAKNTLVASNLRLVFFVAKKYTYVGAHFLDLVQEGSIGLMQAVERFDYRFGYAFSSYATIWIKHAILNALSKFESIATEEEVVLDSVEEANNLTPMELVSGEDLCKAARQALSRLSDREAEILRLRFGIGVPCPYTLKEVSERFKVSRERIRQIEAKALQILRDQGELYSLKTFLKD
jgi:RNA polymerase sigma factor (sigma-70 family)